MSDCVKCAAYVARRTFPMPEDYLAFVDTLIESVKRGDLQMIKADCPLENVLKTPTPEDSLVHEFRCTGCGTRFQLYANTYNGRNWWRRQQWPEMQY
ncbi:MAG TPA: hypothetical protein VMG31_13015 [Verrucomicrobiae bacterium]|nr:hypothetical protein [Verrucomicrobiae bacterium]